MSAGTKSYTPGPLPEGWTEGDLARYLDHNYLPLDPPLGSRIPLAEESDEDEEYIEDEYREDGLYDDLDFEDDPIDLWDDPEDEYEPEEEYGDEDYVEDEGTEL